MWENIQPVVQDFVGTLATGLLGVLSAFLIALAKQGFDWLKVKVSSIKDENVAFSLSTALAHLHETVNSTVTSLQQTLGDDIKESIKNADGVYTREDLLALTDKALCTIKGQLNESYIKILQDAYNDLDGLILDLIQTKVYELKNGTTTLTATATCSSKTLLG